MSSRDKILGIVKNNQPSFRELPPLPASAPGFSIPLASGIPSPLPTAASIASPPSSSAATPAFATAPDSSASPAPAPPSPNALAQKLVTTLEAIGGAAYIVRDFDRITSILQEKYPDAKRIVSNCPELSGQNAGSLSVQTSGEPAFAQKISGLEDPHSLENIDLTILPAHFGVAENGACWITEDLMIERVVPFICQHLVLVIDKKNVVADMHAAYDRIASSAYGFGTFIAGPSKTADIEQSLVLGAHGPMTMTLFLLDAEMSDEGFY